MASKTAATLGLPLDNNHLGGGPFARLVKAAGAKPITLHVHYE